MPNRHAGFALVVLLVVVAVIGLSSAVTATVLATEKRREAELQLLYVGLQYRTAIQRYYEASPGGRPQFPACLEDLLKDPRYPGTRRYLRFLYADPITGRNDWQLVASPSGGIAGIHSRSQKRPIKLEGFDPPLQGFAHRASYEEWVFCYLDCPVQPLTQPEVKRLASSRRGLDLVADLLKPVDQAVDEAR